MRKRAQEHGGPGGAEPAPDADFHGLHEFIRFVNCARSVCVWMLELEVSASNERGRSVYQRWGFTPAEITLAATIDELVERLPVPRSPAE